jgi:hypothetical protein
VDRKKKGRQKPLTADVVERNMLRVEFEARENLPALEGTRRQIVCARSIRMGFISRFLRQWEHKQKELRPGERGKVERLFQKVKAQRSAERWIRALGPYQADPFKLLLAVVRKERTLYEEQSLPSSAKVLQKPEPLSERRLWELEQEALDLWMAEYRRIQRPEELISSPADPSAV